MARIVREIDPAAVPQAQQEGAAAVREALRSVTEAPAVPQPDQRLDLPLKAEVVESCELRLPDGATVLLTRPKYPAILAVARAFKSEQDNSVIMTLAKIMCYVRSIDGESVGPLANEIDFRNLMARLGDDGIDMVSAAYAECWPPVGFGSLPALKKNLRGP